jgi:hypothetical protein
MALLAIGLVLTIFIDTSKQTGSNPNAFWSGETLPERLAQWNLVANFPFLKKSALFMFKFLNCAVVLSV